MMFILNYFFATINWGRNNACDLYHQQPRKTGISIFNHVE